MTKRFFLISAHAGVNAMPAIHAARERCPHLSNLTRLRLVRQEVVSRTGWWNATITDIPLQADQTTQRLEFSDEYPEHALSDVPTGFIVFDEACRLEFEKLLLHASADVLGHLDAKDFDSA